MPFELRPHPTPTLRPEAPYLQNAWKQAVYPLAAEMGVFILLPDVSPQPHTRLAFEGLEFAKDHDAASAYNDAVMRAFFQQSRNIGEPSVLGDIAEGVGLPRDNFLEALRNRAYSERVATLLREAENQRVTAVPMFVIGAAKLVGLHSRQRLEAVISEQGEVA
jgi:predicted DsbA family dithiol-disulfide isomerase